MVVLALESSCDETAVAVLRDSNLLASEVASQIAAHQQYGGIVPEVASRNHLVHAPRLVETAMHRAKINVSDVAAFAATSGPGLASSLMIGASIAKGMALAAGKPYLAINHLEGHLVSPFFGREKIEPNVALIVSGGHTMSILVRDLGEYQLIGRTVDDAAGEAFDKVAKMLGLGYPGGPEIEKRAKGADAKRFDLPRSMLDSDNFSFSGLKTAVRYLLPKIGLAPSKQGASTGAGQDEKLLADVCASFQQAVVDVLVQKTISAAQAKNARLVTVSGGVSGNGELRRQLAEACAREGLELKVAEPWLCTDNAAMIAFAALLRWQSGFESKIIEEIDPNLALV